MYSGFAFAAFLVADLLFLHKFRHQLEDEKLANSLTDLPDHKYEIVHYDTKDERGIYVAFIYDTKKIENRNTSEDRRQADISYQNSASILLSLTISIKMVFSHLLYLF
jgi:hypothetical protein